jgi:hypothetical protein
MVAAATYKEHLTITLSLNIVGVGARAPIIDGGGSHTVVTVSSAKAHVGLSKLTIRNGFSTGCGGGIYNIGTLTINGSTISANHLKGDIENFARGAGICNGGRLTINTTSINGNTMTLGVGGGIYSFGGMVTINTSTVSQNNAFRGGGIRIEGGAVTINNSTISGNGNYPNIGLCAGIDGGAMAINNSTISRNSGPHGGAGFCGMPTIQNSVVADNAGGNCEGLVTSLGYNLSSDGTCNLNGPGDLNNADPQLGDLQNNGGPTKTMALLPGSPAIDAGNPRGCTDGKGHLLKTDQRGRPRPDSEDSGGCDMGAYERQSD